MTTALSPLRVLVAEDNAVNQQLARALLEREGHAVTLAVNGQEAVDFARRSEFDLVLMDIQMPVLDGLDATRQIRAWERAEGGNGHIPIIALTARAMAGDREICLAAGMDFYLSKPMRSDALFSAIEQLVAPAVSSGDPVAPGVSDDVFDGPSLLQIAGGDAPLARQLADLFLDDAPAQLDAMRSAVAAGDARALREAAHAMAGAAATISAGRVTAQARSLERELPADSMQQAAAGVDALEHELSALRDRLATWCTEC